MTETYKINLLVVVPVYNNEKTVAGVVSGVLETGLPVLVVNDGSTDGSSTEIEGLPVERIDFPGNRGKGHAVRRSLKWAKEHNFTHIVTIDADGQHDPKDIAKLIKKVKECPDRIIIGKRDFGANVPGKSRFGRTWSNMWIRIASGGITPDSQSGYRAYPVNPLVKLNFLGSRYEFEVEVLVRAVWAGLELDWADVSVKYFEGEERVSHFKPLRDNLRISIAYTLLVTRNLLPIPHRKFVDKKKGFILRQAVKESKKKLKGLSIIRPLRSLRQLQGNDSALLLALSGWLGAAVGVLPLMGFHAGAIVSYAKRFGLNRGAALFTGRYFALSLLPLVPVLSVQLGHYFHFGRFLTVTNLDTMDKIYRIFGREIHLRLLDYLIGGMFIGFFGGVVLFLVIFFVSRRVPSPSGDHR